MSPVSSLVISGVVMIGVAATVLVARNAKSGSRAKDRFVPHEEIEILAFDGEKRVESLEEGKVYRFVSNGMAKRGLPELEVVEVPAALGRTAGMLINNVARYILNHHQMSNGETLAVDLGFVVVGARCVEVTHGLQKVLRIEDMLDGGRGPMPLMALTSFLYLEAMLAIEGDGDRDAAMTSLELAVRLFPGSPTDRAYKYPKPLFNQANHLAYLAIANEESGDSSWYRKAIERSDVLERYELGASSLPDLSRETLVEDALELVRLGQTAVGCEPWGEAKIKEGEASSGGGIMAFLASPIPRAEGRIVSATPVPFRRYFYEKPISDRLRSRAAAELAADVYRRYRSRPVDFLLLIRETRALYEGAVDPKGAHGLQAEGAEALADERVAYKAHYRMLGSVLADIGRKLGAGLSMEELSEHYQLAATNRYERTIRDKLEKQEALESKYMMAALGL